MNISSRPIFAKMKPKPIRVTIFGASHSGRSSTKAFHCDIKMLSIRDQERESREGFLSAYVWLQDILGYRRLVDRGILVGFEMNQGIVRDTLCDSAF
jgi:hypothetical protein